MANHFRCNFLVFVLLPICQLLLVQKITKEMNTLFRYSLKGISALFFGYVLILSLIRNTVYRGEQLPVTVSFFTYTFFGFWAGMLFMSFLYRNARKNTKE